MGQQAGHHPGGQVPVLRAGQGPAHGLPANPAGAAFIPQHVAQAPGPHHLPRLVAPQGKGARAGDEAIARQAAGAAHQEDLPVAAHMEGGLGEPLQEIQKNGLLPGAAQAGRAQAAASQAGHRHLQRPAAFVKQFAQVVHGALHACAVGVGGPPFLPVQHPQAARFKQHQAGPGAPAVNAKADVHSASWLAAAAACFPPQM